MGFGNLLEVILLPIRGLHHFEMPMFWLQWYTNGALARDPLPRAHGLGMAKFDHRLLVLLILRSLMEMQRWVQELWDLSQI